MLITLHMDAQIALCCRRVLAHITSAQLVYDVMNLLLPVGFISTRIRLTPCQFRMSTIVQTVDARDLIVGVLLLHVNLQRLLVFVVPVALGTLQCLARIARCCDGGMLLKGKKGFIGLLERRVFVPA